MLYTYSWLTAAWTQVGGGAVLNTTASVYGVSFADVLILSDGVGRPIAYDGTTTSTLTSAPIAFGQPIVYAAKVFFISALARNEIQWSEEQNPAIGYGAAGYANLWRVAQTDTGPLFAMAALESSLVLFRARSTTAIYGATSDEFRSTAVRDGVSENYGTTSPASVVVAGGSVFFLDADLRPRCYVPGSGVDDLGDDCANALTTIATDAASRTQAWGVYDDRTRLVIFGLVGQNSSAPDIMLTFDAERRVHCGVWSGFYATAIASVTTDAGESTLVHGTATGRMYQHGGLNGSQWNNTAHVDDGGTTPVRHVISGAPLAHANLTTEIRFSRLHTLLRLENSTSGVGISYRTPRGQSAEFVVAGGNAGSSWNAGVWNTALWGLRTFESKRTIGLNGLGRWCVPIIRHEALGERFGWLEVELVGQRNNMNPGAR